MTALLHPMDAWDEQAPRLRLGVTGAWLVVPKAWANPCLHETGAHNCLKGTCKCGGCRRQPGIGSLADAMHLRAYEGRRETSASGACRPATTDCPSLFTHHHNSYRKRRINGRLIHARSRRTHSHRSAVVIVETTTAVMASTGQSATIGGRLLSGGCRGKSWTGLPHRTPGCCHRLLPGRRSALR
ncbi:hypothetical protein LZ30DRAFT_428771 [Colletotrichum cereale]|nr:hypothetical protein LZ30DRAFT_428771 [Colletotrichum cereale]